MNRFGKPALFWIIVGLVTLSAVSLGIAALQHVPNLSLFARYMLDIRNESVAPATVREHYDHYRDRIVCFPGTAKNVAPFPAPSLEDPLSPLLEDVSGTLDVQTAEGEAVSVWATRPDAFDWEATAVADVTAGAEIKVCGSPVLSPTFNREDETRLVVVGRIVEHRPRGGQASQAQTRLK
ncbi:hypothetical protein P3W85_34140 [Cupriavidus basilensis]|uniref:Uncharacterized protein n=1 Tax=Cupriavidus basilensis TaxID=68895 RepID=A0ABT6AZA6_9BURK|nr:hypothetical protein [Cupriavidus basilensis]MDF3837937.1 hypothetical protein [Cupriavidus basilensis]